ncbi:hypothetical protein ACI8AC_24965 [Geodermatophilus sp. SYSU D00758]
MLAVAQVTVVVPDHDDALASFVGTLGMLLSSSSGGGQVVEVGQ